jgi:hypothetical protein
MNKLVVSVIMGGFAFAFGITAGCLSGSGGSGKPRLCVPDTESEIEGDLTETSRECQSCVRRSCNLDADCSDRCDAYYRCTCACDGDDEACFDDCQDERTRSCETCIERSTNDLLDCVQDECANACLSGGVGSLDDGGGAGEDGWGDDDGWPGGDDDGSPGGDDGGGGGGGGDSSAACKTLRETCCPKLSGFDKELCESADDALTCELWLDLFREEGSC